MSIHTIGDSHCCHGWRDNIISHWLVGCLCYSFGKRKLERCDIRQYNIKDGDTIIFCFGEIDCRCHIHKHITQENTYKIIIENIVNDYLEAIKLNINICDIKLKNVCIYNVVPPFDSGDRTDVPGNEERKKYVLYFNELLKQKCIDNNFIFFDIYNNYIDINGLLRKDLSDGSVHIKDGKYINIFIDKYINRMNNSNKIIDSSGCYWRETWSHTTYWSKSSMIIKPDIIFTSLAEYNLHRGRAQNTPRDWADFIINNDALNDKCEDIDTKEYIKLRNLQKLFILSGGDWNDELPEQLLSLQFIKSTDKVLELGGNIGRNSLIISALLENQKNLVVLEPNIHIFELLKKNKIQNKCTFNIENSALSKTALWSYGWNTYDNPVENSTKVDIITFEELHNRYNINFNVLVCDCEGALYYILKSFNDMLNNFDTIILENDFDEVWKKEYVDDVIKKNNFKCVVKISGGSYVQSYFPSNCKDNFYEVWKK